MSDAVVEPSLSYETPPPRPPGRTFAAAAVLFGGVALAVVGGCFLIGILLTMSSPAFNPVQPRPPLTPGEITFISVLGVLAAASFGGSVALIVLGARALLRVTRM